MSNIIKKFRGKALVEDNEEFDGWVYGNGFFIDDDGDHVVMDTKVGDYEHSCVIKPETLGLYLGFSDNKEREVYEGDIVKCTYFRQGAGSDGGVYEVEEELTGVLSFDGMAIVLSKIEDKNGKWQEYTGYENGEGSAPFVYLFDVYESSSEAQMGMEVIATIHDNTVKQYEAGRKLRAAIASLPKNLPKF